MLSLVPDQADPCTATRHRYVTSGTMLRPSSTRAPQSVHGKPVRILGPGDYFGEMALIDHSIRSATITAETDLRCLLFVSWVFRPFAMEHPETAWVLLEMMVKRVRDAEAR